MFWKYIVVGVCMFFIGGIVSIFIPSNSLGGIKKDFWFRGNTSQSVIDTTSPSYQAGFDAARKLVEESSLGGFFRKQSDSPTITGTVTAIQDNRITLKNNSTQNDSLNILFDIPVMNDRTIIIDATTEVTKLEEDASSKPQGEAGGYQMVRQIKPDGSVAESTAHTYTETPSNVSAIHTGDVLVVIVPEGAKTATEFVAQKILINPLAK